MSTLYFNSYEGIRELTNFSPHPVVFTTGGRTYHAKTAEHAYQWSKFYRSNHAHARDILRASTPAAAKRLGKYPGIDRAWSRERSVVLMKALLQLKVDQHPAVKTALMSTGNATLVHKAPWDSFWGDGKNGRGQNVLGKLWMEIRTELKLTSP